MKLSLAGPLAVAAALLAPRVASAQEAPPPPRGTAVATEETTTQATGPSMAMVGSGIVLFGVSYVPAVVVAGVSHLTADRTMLVPVAGPWIDLTQRPGCSPASQCNTENTNKVLIVADGIVQGIGVLTVLGGLLTTSHETRTVQRSADEPSVHITPSNVGTGYGVAAVGTF